MRIIFLGTSNFSACHLYTLLTHQYNVVGILTKPDRPAGRGKKLTSSPVKIMAKDSGIPVFQPLTLFSKEVKQIISVLNAEIIVVVSYGLILPKEILCMPYFGCINVHASLLPRWRGAAPIQRSLLAGDKETGISIIRINTELDAGNILYKLVCPISDKETSFTLCNKLTQLGQKGLIAVLKKIVNREILPEVQQDESLVTYAKKLHKSEAYVDWSLSAIQLERCVRAFNPWPISRTTIHNKPIKIWRASAIKTLVNEKPGTIIKVSKQGIQVATGKGILNLEELQFFGKKPVKIQDYVNSNKWFFSGIQFS